MTPYERSYIVDSHIRSKYRSLAWLGILAMCAGVIYGVITIIDAAL